MTDQISHSSKHGSSRADDRTLPARKKLARPESAPAASTRNAVPMLPNVGESLFGFRLLCELGKGSFARVHLAHQDNLASRKVVVKISGIDGDEPQTLAQLQHTHIVPIYSVHEDAGSGLRAVCMPYFGGASLSAILQTAWAHGKPTRGEQLVAALDTLMGQVTPEAYFPPINPSVRNHLCAISYEAACVWMVGRLADALQHAHERGVLHRDIKPSNVLVTSDAQPMLLDFNVSQSLAKGDLQTSIGGTVAYMAPEHLQAHVDGQARVFVDQRSDIYSLGMVLYEMLVGRKPFDQTGSYSAATDMLVLMAKERGEKAPSIRAVRPETPWSLESVLNKALAPDAAARYQRADHFGEDLKRFLDDRPLHFAPELSKRERIQKWVRRHPRLTSSGSVIAVASVLLGVTLFSISGLRGHLHAAQDALEVANAQDARDRFEAGVVDSLCLLNTVSDLRDQRRDGIALCEKTLGIFDVLHRDDWQSHPYWRRLATEDRARLGDDVRELLIVLAWARCKESADQAVGATIALALLDRAEKIDGLPPSRALWEDRARYHELAGNATAQQEARQHAAMLEPNSARDHYVFASTLAKGGKHREAIAALNYALALQPANYWALMQRGLCQLELGRDALASSDFSQCIGIRPELAWGWFNRGVAHARAGRRDDAINDYSAALTRDPAFLAAQLNRGMVRLELKAFEPALADFEHCLSVKRNDAVLLVGRGVALEGLQRFRDADDAFAQALQNLDGLSPELSNRLRWVYGFAVNSRRPDAAQTAFTEVLKTSPDQPQALYGVAMAHVEQGREKDGLALLNRALLSQANFIEARRARAIVLARLGRFSDAVGDSNWCLDRDPDSGASHYAAACVASLFIDRAPTDKAKSDATEQALTLLRRALELGYGHAQHATDPDLAPVRRDPRFPQKQG